MYIYPSRILRGLLLSDYTTIIYLYKIQATFLEKMNAKQSFKFRSFCFF